MAAPSFTGRCFRLSMGLMKSSRHTADMELMAEDMELQIQTAFKYPCSTSCCVEMVTTLLKHCYISYCRSIDSVTIQFQIVAMIKDQPRYCPVTRALNPTHIPTFL